MMIAKHTLNTLENLPSVITDFMNTVPEEILDRKRNAETWTAREHLYHLVDVQEMLLQRILTIRDNENPVIEPFFPENEEISQYKNVAGALEKYRDLRKKQMNIIYALKDADLSRHAVHKEYSDYSIPIIVNHMIFHEYWHMYRMEEICYTKDEFFS